MVDILLSKAELENVLKLRASSAEDRYKILDARDKLLRLLLRNEVNLGIGFRMQGTCPDMCPEKERLFRDAKHQISVFELCSRDGISLDHNRAVKQYTRSSANQESPLAHEVRPESVLRLTMDYLINEIMDNLENLQGVHIGEWYHFLWDRTRSVRKDIMLQELCSTQAVFLVEECARFHIHCAARFVAEEPAVFDQKINTENLTKCLQTLKYMYNDLRLKNIHCINESEFRGYIVLLNLNDSNFLSDIKILSVSVRNSQEIKFALEVAKAVASNNYVRFFTLVRRTSYLNACLLLRYFTQIRLSAIRTMMKSYLWPRSIVGVPVVYLYKLLAFESVKCCTCFFEEYGLRIVSNKVMLERRLLRSNQEAKTFDRAINIVESKLKSSVGQVVYGKSSLKRYTNDHVALNSFDNNGYLKDDAFSVHECLNYLNKSSISSMKNILLTQRPTFLSNTRLDSETGTILTLPSSEHAVSRNKNTHIFSSIPYDSVVHAQQKKIYLNEKGNPNDSYIKLELANSSAAPAATCQNMDYTMEKASGLQPWVDKLFNKRQTSLFTPEKDIPIKNSLEFDYQLINMGNPTNTSMNMNNVGLNCCESIENLIHNQKIVEDIIINFILCALEQISKYELAKSEEIREKSCVELDRLIDNHSSIHVPLIAYDQLNMFKKIKISKFMEAPSSWISDNILNNKYTIELSEKSFSSMPEYKIAKSNENIMMSLPTHSKSFSMSSLSVFLRIPNHLKILVSLPDRFEANERSSYLLKSYAKIANEDENCISTNNFSDKGDNLPVCLLKMVGLFPSRKSIAEYSNKNALINAVIFVMTLTNTILAEKRLHSLLTFLQNSRAIPVHLIVCDFNAVSGVKRHTSQLDHFILKSCFLNHTVNICRVNEDLSHVFIDLLKHMSTGEYAHSELGMQGTKSFLCNVLGSYFWRRISEAWFAYSSFRQYCADPYRIIQLYNEALKRVCELLSNRRIGTVIQAVSWKNNRRVIRFIERLKLDATDLDFSSFECLKQTIDQCRLFTGLPQNSAVKAANNVLQHFPDNFTVQRINQKTISWIGIVKAIALQILDSNWIIYDKDLPDEVIYEKALYNYVTSNVWWMNKALLSHSETTSATLGGCDYRKEKTEPYEDKTATKGVKAFQKVSCALKRKELNTDMSRTKKAKSMLDYYRHKIFKEELQLRNCEVFGMLEN